VIVDLGQPPERQLSARVLMASIGLYNAVGHRVVPQGHCRFRPTCSGYAAVVIREHGTVKGGWLAARRVLRCGPWTEPGTVDPPPTRVSSPG
jgi:hypothetical protein